MKRKSPPPNLARPDPVTSIRRIKRPRQRELAARYLLLHQEEIASADPKNEEALRKYVHQRGWKSLYRHKRKIYFQLKQAAKQLDDGDDPRLKAARARGRAVLPKLRAAEGGSISVEQAAKRLSVGKATVLRRYRAGRLIGWQQDGIHRFPVWQFHSKGLLPGLERILNMFRDRPYEVTDTQKLLLLLSKYDFLGGKSALAMLRAGKTEEVAKAVLGYLEE